MDATSAGGRCRRRPPLVQRGRGSADESDELISRARRRSQAVKCPQGPARYRCETRRRQFLDMLMCHCRPSRQWQAVSRRRWRARPRERFVVKLARAACARCLGRLALLCPWLLVRLAQVHAGTVWGRVAQHYDLLFSVSATTRAFAPSFCRSFRLIVYVIAYTRFYKKIRVGSFVVV